MSMDQPQEITKIKILGPEVGYTDLLDYEIIEKIKKESDQKWFPLRPSSAGYCGRRLAYELNEQLGNANYEKQLKSPETYRLLNLGNSVEYSALRNLELLPGFKLKYKQQTVTCFKLEDIENGSNGPLIDGSIDVVLWSDKYKCVLDVKSAKDGWSQSYKSRWDETLDKFNGMPSLSRIGESAWYADDLSSLLKDLNGDFLADNLYQLNVYACTEFIRQRGIDHAVIYKYGKNDSRHYEIRFRPSLEIFNQTKDKFNRIFKAAHAKTPETIERESFLGSMKCAFCPFSKTCWDTDALKAWYKTMPKKEWPINIEDTSPEIQELFPKYVNSLTLDAEKSRIEDLLLKALTESNIRKIRIDKTQIFEVKYYKTPRPHFELKKGKL